jgi:hypothetical protein
VNMGFKRSAKAILDPSFASTFADDSAIEKELGQLGGIIFPVLRVYADTGR